MRFPYTTLFSSKDRPIIPVILEQQARRRIIRGLLDTGADVTLLPYKVALDLGVSLGTPCKIGTATGQTISYRPGQITLELRTVSETARWRAEVGFTAAPLSVPVFGDSGFLEFFLCEFDGELREAELTTKNNLLRVS